ncbi:MAG: 30S ribosomal protein S12 methylthiotransferase RimO [Thermoguttaceae bacterium]|nr:30S ribosomal protein S12 methylthiotransferase RimO [Thermoguttaceae bacterium]
MPTKENAAENLIPVETPSAESANNPAVEGASVACASPSTVEVGEICPLETATEKPASVVAVEKLVAEIAARPDAPTPGWTFSVASLGCPKNLVDAETMVGRLAALGGEMAPEAESVDVFLLNTCGFLRSARDEAAEFIAEAVAEKAAGGVRFLLVSGCAVVSDGEELSARFPEVDAWLSPFDEAKIVDVVCELFAQDGETKAHYVATEDGETTKTAEVAQTTEDGENSEDAQTGGTEAVETSVVVAPSRFRYTPSRNLTRDDSLRTPLTAPNVAYLKIADGCDRFCAYCAIPKIRGRFVSKPLETIVDEAERLAVAGVRELVLIAQETTFWGSDLFGEPRLAQLLATLKEKNWFDWIRVLYTYPQHWGDELTSLYRLEAPGTTSILPYVDVPLQHCNSELLKKMNRRVDKAQTEDLLAKLREEIPGLVLRTSLIVGFPGETDAAYQELVDFVEKWKFERAGVFEFSAEPGTPAAAMDGQVPEEIKRRRLERICAKQERISRRFARSFIGRTVDVMLDSRGVSDGGTTMRNVCVGRTYAEAPDVDPLVYVTGRDLEVGSVVRCEIVDAQGLDLIAVPTDPEKIFVSKDERRIAAEREEAARARELGLEPPKKQAPKKTSNGPKGGKNGGWKKDGGKGGPKGGKSGGWKKGGGKSGKPGGWKKGGGKSGKPSGNAD